MNKIIIISYYQTISYLYSDANLFVYQKALIHFTQAF